MLALSSRLEESTMRLTLAVLQIPASHTAVLLIGIFLTPALYGGGGSPLPV